MSDKPDQYQCRLQRPGAHGGTMEITAWIEARGAGVGKKVELITSEGKLFWEVVEVGAKMSGEQLKKHQSDHRKSFSSIEPIGAPAKNVGTL